MTCVIERLKVLGSTWRETAFDYKERRKQKRLNALNELICKIAKLLDKARPSNFSSFVNSEDDLLSRKPTNL